MSLNYLQLKLFAIMAMTIDHIAWTWIETGSTIGQFLHFIGRITAPLMCFLLVEGFYRTKDYRGYVFRLFIFALLSQLPFVLMLKGIDAVWLKPTVIFFKFNILFNLLFALLALGIIYKTKLHLIVKMAILLFLFFCSFKTDWGVFIIAFTLAFAYFRDLRKIQLTAYTITAMGLLLMVDLGFIHDSPTLVLQWMPMGMLMVPFILRYSNHTLGPRWGGKYFFYLYYPVHMMIIAIIAWRIAY